MGSQRVGHDWATFTFTSLPNNKCFTMLCWFLLYNKLHYIPSLLSLPLIHVHPTPLGCNTAASWAPCAIQQLSTICCTHGSIHMSMLLSQFTPPSSSSTVSTSPFSTFASLFLPLSSFSWLSPMSSTRMLPLRSVPPAPSSHIYLGNICPVQLCAVVGDTALNKTEKS